MAGEQINSIDDFLNHKTRTNNGGGFLSNNWKKGDPAEVDIWLHRRRLPISLWQHRLPTIVIRENDDTGEKENVVWSKAYVCREDEAVLKQQYFRDRDTGHRQMPPRKCGVCRLIEYCITAIDSGELKPWTPILEFKGAKGNVVLHAGGICKKLNPEDMSNEEKAAARKAGIDFREVFKENAYARANYLFTVVDNSDPAAGLQFAIEAQLLGDKVKKVIADTRKSFEKGRMDPSLADPTKHPYCIQWEFNKDPNCQFNDKYMARRLEHVKLTPKIDELISGDPPDVRNIITPYNAQTMRALLERASLVELPWDEIWACEPVEEEEVEQFPTRAAAPTPVLKQAAPSPEEDVCPVCNKTEAQGCQHVACDECGAPTLGTDTTCSVCGVKFEPLMPKLPEPQQKFVAPKTNKAPTAVPARKQQFTKEPGF
jgi:hypothetical protein